MDILQAKLHLPLLTPYVIPRPRLFRKIDSCLENKLCLLSTAAGYGKTTLVVSWAAQRKLPLAWVSLDEDDNDFVTVFSYLVAAVQRVYPGFGASLLNRMTGPQPMLPRACVDLFINALYELAGVCVIAVDNFQELRRREIHTLFQHFIENLPPQIHLVVASRTKLPFSVANLRAQHQVVEIDDLDLCFTEDEARLFFKRWKTLNLTEKEIAFLVENTEGWITALHLAGLSLERHTDTTQFLDGLTKKNRYISEYLLDEVFSLQTPEIQRFLLESSVCTRFTAVMCDAVLNIDVSAEIIKQLDQSNLYMIPLDEQVEWYRYHTLFAELLYSRLQTDMPERARKLGRNASIWCEQHGLVEDAIEYALRCADYCRAAALIESIGKELLWRGRIGQLLRWLGMLPETAYHHHAILRPLEIWAFLNATQFRAAADRLRNTDLDKAILEHLRGIDRQRYQELMSALRGLIAMNYHLDIAQGGQQARIAIENRTASDGLSLMSPLIYGKACAHSGDLDLAEEHLTQSVPAMMEMQSPFMIMLALHHLGEFAFMRGNLPHAEDLFWEACEHGLKHDLQDTSAFSKIHIDIGRVCYEHNNLETAKHYLLEGIRVAEPYMIAYDVIEGYCAALEIARLQHNLEAALHFARRVQLLARKCDLAPALVERAAAAKAKTDLLAGNVRAAQEWLENSALLEQDSIEFYQYYEAITAIEVLVALKRLAPAQVLCQRLLANLEAQHRCLCATRVQTWLASIYYQQGELRKAMPLLLRACDVSAREGYVRALLDVGDPIPAMLAALPNFHRQHSLTPLDPQLEEYLARITDSAHVLSPDSNGYGERFNPLDTELLTKRELETLRLLASGCSNQHIAEKLVVSRSTVKYHLANIYSKLGVSSRTQAIAQAVKLHLV